MKKGWIEGWVGLAGLVVGAIALIVAIIAAREDIATWAGYDGLRKGADENHVRILVAKLRADEDQRFTAELEEALQRNGRRFRRLGREWKATEEQRLDAGKEREAITKLLDRHESEVLLHGYVGLDGARIAVVSIEEEQPMVQHMASSEEDFNHVVQGLDSTLAAVIQSRIEANKWMIGSPGRHAQLNAQVEDLLTQVQTEEARREISFQAAFAKSKLGFWKQDENLVEESAQIYEQLLRESPPPQQEAFIRINLGSHYAEQGEKRQDTALLAMGKEHFSRAEVILVELPDVDRWAKVRTLQSNADLIAYSIDGDTNRVEVAIKRQTETLEDATGWLTQARHLLTEQELFGGELLLAYEQKDRERIEHYHKALEDNREVWAEWAEQAGQSRNPWILSLMYCTAERLVAPERWEEILRDSDQMTTKAKDPDPLRWSLSETVARRERAEGWVKYAKTEASADTYLRQLGRFADLTREEALRSHDQELLAQSFSLTQEFRRRHGIEEQTHSYMDLDLTLPFTKSIFEIESTLALACADRAAIKRMITLHELARRSCTGAESSCKEANEWMDEHVKWLKHGLAGWHEEARHEAEEATGVSFANDANWSHPEPHALRLREHLRGLPPKGRSLCPARVAWVD